MTDADCTPGREPRSVAASYSIIILLETCESAGLRFARLYGLVKMLYKELVRLLCRQRE